MSSLGAEESWISWGPVWLGIDRESYLYIYVYIYIYIYILYIYICIHIYIYIYMCVHGMY